MRVVHPYTMVVLTITSLLLCLPLYANAQNHVLSLDSDGDYIEIADSLKLNNVGSQVTVEAWVKLTAFPNQYSSVVYQGDELISNLSNRSYLLAIDRSGLVLLAAAPEGRSQIYLHSPGDLIALNTWVHIAGVIDATNGTMGIYLNGMEVARQAFAQDIQIHTSKRPMRIGWAHEEHVFDHFAGQLDEVRIWNITRTPQQIQQSMFTTLSGDEPGLVAYYTFEGKSSRVVDTTTGKLVGILSGDAKRLAHELPRQVRKPTSLWGVVRDELGKPVHQAQVQVRQGKHSVAEAETDMGGKYRIILIEEDTLDVYVIHGALSDFQAGIRVRHGADMKLDHRLRENISIEGRLLMLDHKTAHVAVPVQVTQKGRAIATTLSDRDGFYRFVDLNPGVYQLRCQVWDGYLYYQANGTTDEPTKAGTLSVEHGKTLRRVDLQFARLKRGTWTSYTMEAGLRDDMVFTGYGSPDENLLFSIGGGIVQHDGLDFTYLIGNSELPLSAVSCLDRDSEGRLWLGSWYGGRLGLAYYDDQGVHKLDFPAPADRYSESVIALHCGSDGKVWFGTVGGGLFCYEKGKTRRFTKEDGYSEAAVLSLYEDSQGHLWIGTWGRGLFRYDGQNFQHYTIEDGLASDKITCIHQSPDGTLWFGTAWWSISGTGVSWYDSQVRDGKLFQTLTTKDGLVSNNVGFITSDHEGNLWFGTGDLEVAGNGVSRYDGQTFMNFTIADGLLSGRVTYIYPAKDGKLWFGTFGGRDWKLGGICAYDEQGMPQFTSQDGLSGDAIQDICADGRGGFWLATDGGVSHYDGSAFTSLNINDTRVLGVHQDVDGMLWFAANNTLAQYDGSTVESVTSSVGGGVSFYAAPDGMFWLGGDHGVDRYDRQSIQLFDRSNGLKPDVVSSTYQTPDGTVLVGSNGGGVYRYEVDRFEPFLTPEMGLVHGDVWAIHSDPDGTLWFGTLGGVSRYDGTSVQNFTSEDGLSHSFVHVIHRASDGLLYLGTENGLTLYDGVAWSSLSKEDGLPGAKVLTIHESPDRKLWLGTNAGLTYYQRGHIPPKIHISKVTMDESYEDLSSIPSLTTDRRVTIDYSSQKGSVGTGGLQYRFRIRELDERWSTPTASKQFEYAFKAPGTYTFEVQAISRDLNYSQPVTLRLTVVSPLYQRATFLVPILSSAGLIVALLIVLAVVAIHRRRQVHAYERQAVQELQDARQMQLSLLPKQAPTVAGFEFAGVCQPANGVAGDHYTYLWLDEEQTQLLLVLMDVTGHGMQAASAAFVAHGILVSECAHSQRPEDILQRMHARLQQLLPPRSFVAASFILLDVEQQRLTHYNAGLPRPILIRDGEWSALPTRGGLPLGCRLQTEHVGHTVSLESGDVLLLFSDGLPEAEDSQGQMYRELRLELVLGQLSHETHSAEEWVDAFIGDVQSHILSGELRNRNMADFIPSQDDVTLMVLRMN